MSQGTNPNESSVNRKQQSKPPLNRAVFCFLITVFCLKVAYTHTNRSDSINGDVFRDSFVRLLGFIQICAMTHSDVCHDSFACRVLSMSGRHSHTHTNKRTSRKCTYMCTY